MIATPQIQPRYLYGFMQMFDFSKDDTLESKALSVTLTRNYIVHKDKWDYETDISSDCDIKLHGAISGMGYFELSSFGPDVSIFDMLEFQGDLALRVVRDVMMHSSTQRRKAVFL